MAEINGEAKFFLTFFFLGTCRETWNRSFCECSEAFSGADCSVPVAAITVFSLRPTASAQPHVVLNFAASIISLPTVALDFRSRALPAANATLFRLTTTFFTMQLTLLSDNQLLYRLAGWRFESNSSHRANFTILLSYFFAQTWSIFCIGIFLKLLKMLRGISSLLALGIHFN